MKIQLPGKVTLFKSHNIASGANVAEFLMAMKKSLIFFVMIEFSLLGIGVIKVQCNMANSPYALLDIYSVVDLTNMLFSCDLLPPTADAYNQNIISIPIIGCVLILIAVVRVHVSIGWMWSVSKRPSRMLSWPNGKNLSRRRLKCCAKSKICIMVSIWSWIALKAQRQMDE